MPEPSIEMWMPIPGYEGLYWASSFGRVMNARNQIKACRIHESYKKLYYKIDLYRKGERKTFRVNRLILMVFKGEPPQENNVGCHEDGNTLNNRIENLRWDTQQFNIHDYWNRKREAEYADKYQL